MVLCYEKVTRSRFVMLVTSVVLSLYIFIGIGLPLYILYGEERVQVEIFSLWTILGVAILALLPVLIFIPRYVSLTDSCLKLHRGIGVSSFAYDDIKTIRLYSPKNIVTERKFGIGGVGGFIGNFYNPEIGNHVAYVGDYSQAFLIVMKSGKKYMLSCQHSEKIVAQVGDRLRKK